MHKTTKLQLVVACITLLIEVAACIVGIIKDNYLSIFLTFTLSIAWAIWIGMLIVIASMERRIMIALEEQERRGKIQNGVKENPFEEFSKRDEDERKRD